MYGYAIQKTVPYSGNLEACGVSVDGRVMCKGLPWVCGHTLPAGATGLHGPGRRTHGHVHPRGPFLFFCCGPIQPSGVGGVGWGLPTEPVPGGASRRPQ